MDSEILALFVPIVALAIPVAAIVMNGLHKVARLRLEEAQLRFQAGGSGTEEVQELRSEVETLRRELGELNERVDFAERLLARGRDPGAQQEGRP